MAQIRESQFAVMRINDEDIDLMDLSGAGMVSVETTHKYYNSSIQGKINQLNEGDLLYCQIQGEDVLQPNAIWRFLEIEVLANDPAWAYE